MRVMGIDPGLQITGWGVVEVSASHPAVIEAGIVRTNAKTPLEERLRDLHSGINEVIAAHKPQIIAVEDLYSHYQHPKTAILMGHARGVLLLAAAGASVPVFTYSATRIKKCITGNGHASKVQMQRMVVTTLGLNGIPEPPDVCDALAAALTHINDDRRRLD